ncbi:MAG: hypothetical protein P4L61_01540 [Candidatus Pacebacteria bacterium]|nr:hypothetical protein [Candidatus Paceibacterota bacterium]
MPVAAALDGADNYVWLILSAIFFAGGEFLSKKFALNPGITLVVLLLVSYGISEVFWLPAILEKNKLSIVGAIWSVLSLLVTVLLGLVIFKEKLSVVGGLGSGKSRFHWRLFL